MSESAVFLHLGRKVKKQLFLDLTVTGIVCLDMLQGQLMPQVHNNIPNLIRQ
jgi:hypothetical protein